MPIIKLKKRKNSLLSRAKRFITSPKTTLKLLGTLAAVAIPVVGAARLGLLGRGALRAGGKGLARLAGRAAAGTATQFAKSPFKTTAAALAIPTLIGVGVGFPSLFSPKRRFERGRQAGAALQEGGIGGLFNNLVSTPGSAAATGAIAGLGAGLVIPPIVGALRGNEQQQLMTPSLQGLIPDSEPFVGQIPVDRGTIGVPEAKEFKDQSIPSIKVNANPKINIILQNAFA